MSDQKIRSKGDETAFKMSRRGNGQAPCVPPEPCRTTPSGMKRRSLPPSTAIDDRPQRVRSSSVSSTPSRPRFQEARSGTDPRQLRRPQASQGAPIGRPSRPLCQARKGAIVARHVPLHRRSPSRHPSTSTTQSQSPIIELAIRIPSSIGKIHRSLDSIPRSIPKFPCLVA